MEQQPSEQKRSRPGVRTYADDMAKAMRQNQANVNAAISELKQKETSDSNNAKAKKKGTVFLLLTAGILLLAFGIIAFAVLRTAPEAVPLRPSQRVPSIIRTEKEAGISIEGKDRRLVYDAIRQELGKPDMEARSFKNIFFVTGEQRLASKEDFFALIAPEAPSGFRAAMNGRYMLGAYRGEDEAHPFILLQTTLFEASGAGLKAWEKTMVDDLYPLFGLRLDQEDGSLLEKPFEDRVIKNKDARILADADGKILLLYVFIDPSTIILTDSEDALEQVTVRYFGENNRQ